MSLVHDIYAALLESAKATRKARAEYFCAETPPDDSALDDYARNGAMAVMAVIGDIVDGYQGNPQSKETR